jgi:hypothetical protein
MVMAMRFKRTSDCIVLLLGFLMSVVDLRIELSATRLSAGYEPPALDYHVFSVGCVGIEPLSIAPNDLRQPLHFTPDDLLFVSGPAGS